VKRLLLLLVVSLPFAYVPLQAGCNGQSEGQVCSPINGDLDCQTGLTCQTPPGANGSFCCQAGSSHPACLGSVTTTSVTTSSSTSSTTTGTGGTGGGTGTGGTGTGGTGTGGTGTGGTGTGGG